MQTKYPPDRVLISDELPITFSISNGKQYVDIFTKEERDFIINKYRTKNLFNGDCVRLDSIEDGHAFISASCFYDFLCCNIAGIHNRDSLAYSKLSQSIAKYGKLTTFDKVLNVRELPNIIGVSTLLHDVNNDFLLVERNTSVSVGSGLFACTSSGSLDVDDMLLPNPITGCGERELKEELNLNVRLFMEGLVMPIQKLQPIALLTGMVTRPWREIVPVMLQAKDFRKENTRILIVPKDKLLPIISMYSFTDASAYHIFLESGDSMKEWKKVNNTFVNINEFYYKE